LRFIVISIIDIVALSAGVAVGVGMALRGFGYWSLVGTTITSTFVCTASVWLATGWIPGKPQRGVGVGSMLHFGGTITLNGLIVYLAYNLEKVLLGRYWGAEALGLYGRGYQLVSIPTDNLNSAAGSVAFAALSRIQNDPERLRRYFLKGYSLVLALTLPITIVCALFAPDLVTVLLGQKWQETAAVFRLLAPTILIFAMINPLAWLLFSLGLVGRSLNIALVLAPLVICGYAVGLPFGPKGVALGYSTVMALWVVPHIAWCVRGTIVSMRDLVTVVMRPALSGLVAAALPLALLLSYGHLLPPLPRLVIGVCLFVAVYLAMLLGAMKQKDVYLELLHGFKQAPQESAKELVSA
jgi:PST family polysaccharide transporter